MTSERGRNTLWGRLAGMHLGQKSEFSTFRRTLGATLTTPLGLTDADDPRLSAWMHRHLRLVAVPVADPDELGRLEDAVLNRLDPPLNLDGRPANDLRQRLSALRRAARP